MPTVSEHIRDCLVAAGTDYLFQVTGGDAALFVALDASPITMVPCRTEAGATYMADGYARASGRIGWVYGQHGPGSSNIVAAIADAYWAKSTVIALTSCVARNVQGQNAYQEVDQLALFEPVTSWSARAMQASELPSLLRRAMAETRADQPGPTHLEIPRDMFGEEIPEPLLADGGSQPTWRIPTATQASRRLGSVQADLLDRIVSALSNAARPVILAGGGVIDASAWTKLVMLSELTGAPVCTSLAGKGAIVDDHPNAIGVMGRYSRKVANDLVSASDVVLAVGTSLGEMTTDAQRIPSAASTILVLNSTPQSLPTAYSDALVLTADLNEMLDALSQRVSNNDSFPLSPTWLAQAQTARKEWETEFDVSVAAAAQAPVLGPAAVMQAINNVLGADDIVVADTGYAAAWAGALTKVRRAGRTFFRAAGSLGWSIPAAMGVALARPAAKVYCIVGDGGAAYNIAEVETAVRMGIAVTILVLNNSCLAFEDHVQRYLAGHVVEAANNFTDVNFALVAQAFGADGQAVATYDELQQALNDDRVRGGLRLIDIKTDRSIVPPVTSYDRVLTRAL